MQSFAFHAAKSVIVAPGSAGQLAGHVTAWARGRCW